MTKNKRNYTPEDFENMSDDEFEAYLAGIMNGDSAYKYSGTDEEDNADRAEAAEEVDEAAEEVGEAAPFKSFATEDEYNADRQSYADEFSAPLRSDSEKLSRISDMADRYYGENGIDRLLDDLEEQLASEAGASKEDYRRQQELERDAQSWRDQQTRTQESDSKKNEILKRWRTESERLKMRVPEFDFEQAMKNPEFRNMIIDGENVAAAYYAVKLGEANSAKDSRRAPLHQMASYGSSGDSSTNDYLMSLNDKDFNKEIKRLMGR